MPYLMNKKYGQPYMRCENKTEDCLLKIVTVKTGTEEV